MEIVQENREGKKGHLPTEGIILFRPDKRHSVRARKPAGAMMPNDLTKQPLPTHRPPAFLPPSWSQVVFLREILTFKGPFQTLPPPSSLSRPPHQPSAVSPQQSSNFHFDTSPI